MSANARWLVAAALLLAALETSSCSAGSKSVRAVPSSEGTPLYPIATAGPRLTPGEIAASSQNSRECEARARERRAEGDDEAWAVLRACVEKGAFTLLKTVLRSPWREMALDRHDGAALLAAIVAARGGDVEVDGELIRASGFPVYSFSAVPPTTSRQTPSKRIIFRARISEKRPARKAYAIELAEISVRAKHKGYHWAPRTSDTFASDTGRVAWAKHARGAKVTHWRAGDEVIVLGVVEGVANVAERPDREAPIVRYLVRDVGLWESPRTAILEE